MPKPDYDDELTPAQQKEEKKKHAAALKDLAAAVKAFKSKPKAERTDAAKDELGEFVVKYSRILGPGVKQWDAARKLSDTFKRGGRHTRRRSRRHRTLRY